MNTCPRQQTSIEPEVHVTPISDPKSTDDPVSTLRQGLPLHWLNGGMHA